MQPDDLHAFGAAYFGQLAGASKVSSSQTKGHTAQEVGNKEAASEPEQQQ
jgi:hypothetical protein